MSTKPGRLTLYPQSGNQTTSHSANCIKVPTKSFKHILSIIFFQSTRTKGSSWSFALATSPHKTNEPLDHWTIQNLKNTKHLALTIGGFSPSLPIYLFPTWYSVGFFSHLEELNMKCPIRTTFSRSWNLVTKSFLAEISGSLSVPTKHKTCGLTFRLVSCFFFACSLFWGGRWCKTEAKTIQ